MKNAKERVDIHTPYIICNKMMYDSLRDIGSMDIDVRLMTNSVANNANPFGAGDYRKNKDKILETGISIYEYEGGASYHGKSIAIDGDNYATPDGLSVQELSFKKQIQLNLIQFFCGWARFLM